MRDYIYLQEYRKQKLRELPPLAGAYVLRDWRLAHLYVGQSEQAINQRLSRHISGARSDIIASRRICPSEIAFVDFYPIANRAERVALEKYLIFTLNSERPLFNFNIPRVCPEGVVVPASTRFQIVTDEEITRMHCQMEMVKFQSERLEELQRFRRNVKDNEDMLAASEIRRSLLNYHADMHMTTEEAA